MARIPTRSGSSVRGALVCAVVLVAAFLNAPAAVAEDTGAFQLAPAAEQPVQLGTDVSTKSAARVQQASVASASSTAAGCPGVRVAAGSSPASGYLPLSLFGILPIAGVGDETNTGFNVPAFTYSGHTYSNVQVDSNGYVQVGSDATVSIGNQHFPDAQAPNNVLAPFWTDLNPGAAGNVRIGTLTDGSDTWVVVDWEAVPEFRIATNLHSFQIWIGIDGDASPGQDISYAYGSSTGSGDLGLLTVGAENEDGTSGGFTAYNGTGTVPVFGDQLRVRNDLFARFTATPTSGAAPLSVSFDASASFDDGSIASYVWAFGDTGTGSGVTTSHSYAPGTYTATLTVTDNDSKTCSASERITSTRVRVSVNDVNVVEGNTGTKNAVFTVRLNLPSTQTVRVTVKTANGSARAPGDYQSRSVVLTFLPSQTAKSVAVAVVGDRVREPNETYSVLLSNPVSASLGDPSGTGGIINND